MAYTCAGYITSRLAESENWKSSPSTTHSMPLATSQMSSQTIVGIPDPNVTHLPYSRFPLSALEYPDSRRGRWSCRKPRSPVMPPRSRLGGRSSRLSSTRYYAAGRSPIGEVVPLPPRRFTCLLASRKRSHVQA